MALRSLARPGQGPGHWAPSLPRVLELDASKVADFTGFGLVGATWLVSLQFLWTWRRRHGQSGGGSAPLGSAPARLLHLHSEPGGLVQLRTPRAGPDNWDPGHGLSCSS